jgi:hypothetical protein
LIYKFTTGITAQAIGLLGGAAALLAWELTTMPFQHVATLQSSAISIDYYYSLIIIVVVLLFLVVCLF